MRGLFSYDNKIFSILSKFGDMIMLNVIFLITCIPIVTTGAAYTAMYDVTLKMAKNEEAYIIKSYWKSFKANFKTSTIIWLILCAVVGFLVVDLQIVNLQDSTFWYIVRSILISFLVIAWVIFAYIFPLQAKFILSIKQAFRNSIVLAMKHLMCTVTIVTLNSVFLFFLFTSPDILVYVVNVYLVIGFAFVAYINSMLLRRVIDTYVE